MKSWPDITLPFRMFDSVYDTPNLSWRGTSTKLLYTCTKAAEEGHSVTQYNAGFHFFSLQENGTHLLLHVT